MRPSIPVRAVGVTAYVRCCRNTKLLARQPWLLSDTWPDGRGEVLNIIFCASLAKSEWTDLYSIPRLDFKVPLGVLSEGSWPKEKMIL